MFYTRRDFLKSAGALSAGMMLGSYPAQSKGGTMSRVAVVKTTERKEGVRNVLKAFGSNPCKGKDVLIKPNFNTADPTPGSTHNDTLTALIEEIWGMGAKSVSLGERSYPLTQEVMEEKGILPSLEKLQVKVIDFDKLSDRDWVLVKPKASHHWPDGFRVARPILEAECLVSTCCLKTHQFGGMFTMSLKLHVGVVPTSRHGYGYMHQLHGSSYQRQMIAEINEPFTPSLVVLDGVDAFVDGGPAFGKRAKGNLFLASADRVAVDACGVAMLKLLGSNHVIMGRPIFEQEQIARAAELGLGASSPASIELLAEPGSVALRDQLADMLRKG
jgi:uncharacterized protein (DUF362 family)